MRPANVTRTPSALGAYTFVPSGPMGEKDRINATRNTGAELGPILMNRFRSFRNYYRSLLVSPRSKRSDVSLPPRQPCDLLESRQAISRSSTADALMVFRSSSLGEAPFDDDQGAQAFQFSAIDRVSFVKAASRRPRRCRLTCTCRRRIGPTTVRLERFPTIPDKARKLWRSGAARGGGDEIGG